MRNSELSLDTLSWQDFQLLTLHLSENQFPGLRVEEYLKQGNTQQGIDLLSVNTISGMDFTVQCKRTKKISESELTKIVNEFSDNAFYHSSSHFILATTADLQTEKLRTKIGEIKSRLNSDNIQFECWDRKFFNDKLARYHSLVSFFFGKNVADSHCFAPDLKSNHLINVAPKDYIPRNVMFYKEDEDLERIRWGYSKVASLSPLEIFKNNRLKVRRIGIVGDAHQGKSMLLRQLAFQLEQGDVPYRCLFLELKNLNALSIEELLNTNLGSWKQIPAKDLIIFIDGLDEVPSDKFDEMVRNITTFSCQYPSLNVVFSCRRLFYNHFRLDEAIKGFSIFQLCPLQGIDIENYLRNALLTEYDKFTHRVKRANLTSLLHHPFYLTKLVEWFSTAPFKIPKSRIKIIEKIAETSINDNEIKRRLTRGRQLHQVNTKLRKATEKFAITLQMSGLNALDYSLLQELFIDEEIELLQHSSLICINKNSWSFSNAIFQEHLAALYLVRFSFDKILELVTVGQKVRKIRKKWIQTYASLLSILPQNALYSQLVDFIIQDNVELIFTTESSKYDKSFIFECLKQVISQCNNHHIHLMISYEEAIAEFIAGNTPAIDYLFENLEANEALESTKTICIRIIQSLELTVPQKNSLLTIAVRQLRSTENVDYASCLLEALAHFKLGNIDLVKEFTRYEYVNKFHNYRDGLYKLIISLELIDEFYHYGFDGLPILKNHNIGIHHGGSEFALDTLLSSPKSLHNISFLLNRMSQDDWLLYHQHSHNRKQFNLSFCRTIITVFRENPLIIFPFIRFIKATGRRFLRDEYREFDAFFEETEAAPLIVRLMTDDIMNDGDWEILGCITKDCFDFLLFEWEELPELSLRPAFSWTNALRYSKKNALSDELFELLDAATEGRVTMHINETQDNRHQIDQEIKYKNDLIYIQSQAHFRNGVLKYFRAYGKNNILSDELYVDENSKERRRNVDSHFLFRFLLNWDNSEQPIYLNEVLSVVDNKVHFEFIRANLILGYDSKTASDSEILEGILLSYYNEHINDVDFENCIGKEELGENGNKTISYGQIEYLLGQIFQKLKCSTPFQQLMNLVWLDSSGIRGVESHNLNNRHTISQQILECLSTSEKLAFRRHILSNMNKGILNTNVLTNHIGLCSHLLIHDSTTLLLELINNGRFDDYTLSDVIGVYIKLEGDLHPLSITFEKMRDFNSHSYLRLAKELFDYYPSIVKQSLMECLKNTAVVVSRHLEVAKILSSKGELEGFLYLVNAFKAQECAPYSIQGRYKVHMVDTKAAIKSVTDLTYCLLEPDPPKISFADSKKNLMLEWLLGFASKGEEDLCMIVDLLMNSQEILKEKYNNHWHLYWYASRAYENFRNGDKTSKSIDEIKEFLTENC